MTEEKKKTPRVIIDGAVVQSVYQDVEQLDDEMEVIEMTADDLADEDLELVDRTTGRTVISEKNGRIQVNEDLGIIGEASDAPGQKATYRLGEDDDGKTRIRKVKKAKAPGCKDGSQEGEEAK